MMTATNRYKKLRTPKYFREEGLLMFCIKITQKKNKEYATLTFVLISLHRSTLCDGQPCEAISFLPARHSLSSSSTASATFTHYVAINRFEHVAKQRDMLFFVFDPTNLLIVFPSAYATDGSADGGKPFRLYYTLRMCLTSAVPTEFRVH